MYRLNHSSRCIYLIVILLYMISASLSQNYTWKFFPMSLKTLGQPHHHCEVEPRSLCLLGPLPPSCIPSSILNLTLSIFSCLRYFMWWLFILYICIVLRMCLISKEPRRGHWIPWNRSYKCLWHVGTRSWTWVFYKNSKYSEPLNHLSSSCSFLAILLLFEIVTK